MICKFILFSTIFHFLIIEAYPQNYPILPYPIVSTGQNKCFDNQKVISEPSRNSKFYGQDAQFQFNKPDYTDNGDGTITDNITGLMWQKSPDFNNDGIINSLDKKSYSDALAFLNNFKMAGYNDWRLPTTKELYSLFMANGTDPSGPNSVNSIPFIDTNYFPFGFGDIQNGERQIDAQYAASTIYVGKVFVNQTAIFGVNFADGRIKGYPSGNGPNGQPMKYYIKYVRGNNSYGINDFKENGDGTITDKSTGLMWSKDDSQSGMNWENSLDWVIEKNKNNYLGYSDWRLPNVKELQSIIDYRRSPSTSNSAAIDTKFNCTKITVEEGKEDYPFFWTSTTHISASGQITGGSAMYVCFGTAYGFMEIPPNSGAKTLMDVHGAGAQRSDPKIGNPADYPTGRGPQGDVIRINNFVRLVRNYTLTDVNEKEKEFFITPNPVTDILNIRIEEINFGNANNMSDLNYIIIYNTLGEKIDLKTTNSSVEKLFTINVSELSSGVYYIKIGNKFAKFVKL